MKFLVHKVILKWLFLPMCLACATAVADSMQVLAGAVTSAGGFYVELSAKQPIPLNKICRLRFRVLNASDKHTPVKEAHVTASAWMPEHNHGTSLQPKMMEQGGGVVDGTGFLFHMEGDWELRVHVVANGQMEQAVFHIQPQS